MNGLQCTQGLETYAAYKHILGPVYTVINWNVRLLLPRYVVKTVSACSPELILKLIFLMLNLLKSAKFVKEYIDNT